jgi:methyl-accepting chemotaxis protein
MSRLPKLSISAKLYIIFSLVAASVLGLAACAVLTSQQQASLAEKVGRYFSGALNVERVDGLIYAVVMESRGIYMTPRSEMPTVKNYATGLLAFNDQIGRVVEDWRGTLDPDDVAAFEAFAARIRQFQDFRRELVRRALEIGPEAGREWGDNDANRSVRKALNKDIEQLGKLYDARSKKTYAELNSAARTSALILIALAVGALTLAALGATVIWRGIARPLAKITQVTEAVARGAASIEVPFSSRKDEIGALSRSIHVFQTAMSSNQELNRKRIQDAESRNTRQQQVTEEIGRFAGEIELSIGELATMAEQMLAAAANLASLADHATIRTQSAAAGAEEASSNVREIAVAAENLSKSVLEIDAQVLHSKHVAEQAVGEAEGTTIEIQALHDAARRIDEVVQLITDVAKQTNLLALNATIEAARAGEAGRGFAIVASEVKALAAQTATATEEISAHVRAMQDATERSVRSIHSIQGTIQDMSKITAAIASAVSEQSAATKEIARGADMAFEGTAHSAEAVARIQESVGSTLTNAETLKSVAANLGAVARRVRQQVDELGERLRAA